MNYIVLDMEWNQANSYAEMVKDPVMLTGEIVQIGAVKLDETFHAIDSFNQRVKSVDNNAAISIGGIDASAITDDGAIGLCHHELNSC